MKTKILSPFFGLVFAKAAKTFSFGVISGLLSSTCSQAVNQVVSLGPKHTRHAFQHCTYWLLGTRSWSVHPPVKQNKRFWKAPLTTALNFSKITTSFNKSLFRLIDAENERTPLHCTTQQGFDAIIHSLQNFCFLQR